MRAQHTRIVAPLAVAMLAIALSTPPVHAGPATGTSRASTAGVEARVKTHTFAPPGKPIAPIAIGYELSAQPGLGAPFEVRISAHGGDRIADLALTVHAGAGLEVGTPALTQSSADGATRTWTLAVTAFGSGTLYLDVLVQGTAGPEHPARNLAIPIVIGTQAATAAAPPQSTLGSPTERVIVLPASSDR